LFAFLFSFSEPRQQAEKRFITSQTQRRTYADDLIRTQVNVSDLRVEMEKFSRSDDKYLELFQKEHQLIKKEKVIQHQLQQHEDEERELFSSFQLALRESQEKEKMRIERTKYWSVIGSILGALMGILGRLTISFHSSHSNRSFRCNSLQSLSSARIPSSQ
jgi:hypothetical protein